MYKVDLHSHSIASRDGGIRPEQYKKALQQGIVDCIAITDHDAIEMGLRLKSQLGDHIIVGEEISAKEGEIIGLFLNKTVEPGQTALKTVQSIKEQGGLVYIPHPFETIRAGLSNADLKVIVDFIDIVEVQNGRAVFQNKGPKAVTWATLHSKAKAASSDAHGFKGLGRTYCLLNEMPTALTLVGLLSSGRLLSKRPPLYTLLYPKINRARKLVRKQK